MPETSNEVIIIERGQELRARLHDNPHYQVNPQLDQEEIAYVFGLSDFIAEFCITHPDWLIRMFDNNYHQTPCFEALLDEASQDIANAAGEDDLNHQLRLWRNRLMVVLAWQDLLNRQTIEQSLQLISAMADTLILGAYNWLYQAFCHKHGTPMGEHGPQPLMIFAMGKLGGEELNFSSDIDLIFSYPEKGQTSGGKRTLENQQFFIRLAQKLIQSLSKVTVDGQVFRVDMRLRPFGDSGPLVMHFDAFEDYYLEQGRQWERFAMIKARIVNPESAYSARLKQVLTPFVYRKYLDFTTINSIREMKSLIESEVRRRNLTHNIKLGKGGIREVEFFAQSFQLIHGGREIQLQLRSLKQTLSTLAELQLVDDSVIRNLYEDYLLLRKCEHTLQQIGDQQTQTLTHTEHEQAVLQAVMKDQDVYQTIDRTMAKIRAQFAQLVEDPNQDNQQDTCSSTYQDAWQLELDDEELTKLLSETLPTDTAARICELLQTCKQSVRRYRMGERGEVSLNKLVPMVLDGVVSQAPNNIVDTLTIVLEVISAITGRTTYLDLLVENQDVLTRLITLCSRSQWIGKEIQRFPLLLDELLNPIYLTAQTTELVDVKREYQDELRQSMLRVDPDDIEAVMDGWRQFRLSQQLRIAASDLTGSLPIEKVSDKLTVLAEVLLDEVLHHAWAHCHSRYGSPSHLQEGETGFAVIGYGKLGGYELGYGSDLDVVFLHNAPRGTSTKGKKSIDSQQFYLKLAQRIMHLISTKTLFGQLYEIDLRLRPSGNAGLLSSSLVGFEQYQRDDAWTWEHQALVRARGVVGDSKVIEAFQQVRHTILTQRRDQPQLQQDIVSMREKMREHLLKQPKGSIDLKQSAGGITDIEFLTQYWVLNFAATYPAMTRFSDNLNIIDETASNDIIPAATAKQLQQTYLSLRNTHHHLALADQKYASESDNLIALQQQITTIWQREFSSG